MNRARIFVGLILAWMWCVGVSSGHAQAYLENPVRVTLVSEQTSISPGETFWVGLWVEPWENYHTYWRGPGIVGVATGIEWSLPAGFQVGEMEWPAPQRVKMHRIDAHGYYGNVLLMIPLKAPEDLQVGQKVELKGEAQWMCCYKTCHPGAGKVSLTLAVADPVADPAQKIDAPWKAQFEAYRSKVPKEWVGWKAEVALAKAHEPMILTFYPESEEAKKASEELKEVYFFSYDNLPLSNEPQELSKVGDRWHLKMERSPFGPKDPKTMSGVLYSPSGWDAKKTPYVEIHAQVKP